MESTHALGTRAWACHSRLDAQSPLPALQLCYERALEVFELIEDVDKVSKVREEGALSYRQPLHFTCLALICGLCSSSHHTASPAACTWMPTSPWQPPCPQLDALTGYPHPSFLTRQPPPPPQVLINLANLCELQLATVAARREAAEFRKRLVAFLAAHGVRRLDSECAICLEPMAMQVGVMVTHGRRGGF